jgi:hypothetical protein
MYDPELDQALSASEEIGVKAGTFQAMRGFGDWVARRNLSEMIGLGLLCGGLLSIPIIIAVRPQNIRSLVIVLGIAMMLAIIKAAIARWNIKNMIYRYRNFHGVKVHELPKAKVLTAFSAIIGLAFVGIITSIKSPSPTRNPVKFSRRDNVRVAMPKRAVFQGNADNRGVSPLVAPTAPPREIPPLVEEPAELVPTLSKEELEKLRAFHRRAPVATLEPIMQGVQRANKSGEWQHRGWRDFDLEFALDELMYRVRRATECRRLELPVRFGEVPAGVAESRERVIAAMRSKQLSSTKDSILLVDGDLELSFATRCVILATGKVSISHAEQVAVIAGDTIDVSHASTRSGSVRESDAEQSRSLLVSGNTIRVRIGRGLVCAAPNGIEASSVSEATFLNSPLRRLTLVSACSEFTTRRIDFHFGHPASQAQADVRPKSPRDRGFPMSGFGSMSPMPRSGAPVVPARSMVR